MEELFIAGYYDAPELDCPIVKQGWYGLHDCGGASRWVIGQKTILESNTHIWTIPYKGVRYVYVFRPYDDNDKPEDLPFYKKLGGLTANLERSEIEKYWVLILQLPNTLPGFDAETGLWNGDDSDDLQGLLDIIDTEAKEIDETI